MNINRKSWHFRFANIAGDLTYIDSVSLCTYTKYLIGSLLVILFICGIAVTTVAVLSTVFIPSVELGFKMASCILWGALFYILYDTQNSISWNRTLFTLRNKEKKEHQEEDNLFHLWWKSHKEGFCPTLNIIEE